MSDFRRCGFGQDARPHASHRVSARREEAGRGAVAHPRRDVHEQGRRRDERTAARDGRRSARDLWVGTFHSMCVRILRRDGAAIGIARGFTIMDGTDQRAIVRDLLHDLEFRRAASRAGRRARRDFEGQEQFLDARSVRREASVVHRRALRTGLSRVRQATRRIERARFRRSDHAYDSALAARRRRARALSAEISLRDGRRISGRQLRAVHARLAVCGQSTKTSRSSATTISRSIRGAAAITA